MREPNVSKREAVRRYNWLVRKDKEVPVRAELAELVKQIEADNPSDSLCYRNRARQAARGDQAHRGQRSNQPEERGGCS